MSEENASESPSGVEEATVTVSRVVAHPVKEVWKALMTKEGAEALLGEGAEFGQKGSSWTAADGRTGVMRSLHPLEQIRWSWRREGLPAPTMVELDLAATEGGTLLTVIHSKLTPDRDIEDITSRWEAALTRIEECLG
jgi:uncharacterized protein YndB with AHSA1/START domain